MLNYNLNQVKTQNRSISCVLLMAQYHWVSAAHWEKQAIENELKKEE